MEFNRQFEYPRKEDPEWLQGGKPKDRVPHDGVSHLGAPQDEDPQDPISHVGAPQDGVGHVGTPQDADPYDGSRQDEGRAAENEASGHEEAGFVFEQQAMQHLALQSHHFTLDPEAYLSSVREILLSSDDGESSVIDGSGRRGASGHVVRQDRPPSVWHTTGKLLAQNADTALWDEFESKATGEGTKILHELGSGTEGDKIRKGVENMYKRCREIRALATSLEIMPSKSTLSLQIRELRKIASNLERDAEIISRGEESLRKHCQSCASRVDLQVKKVFDQYKGSFFSANAVIATVFEEEEGDPHGEIVSGRMSAEPSSSSVLPNPSTLPNPENG